MNDDQARSTITKLSKMGSRLCKSLDVKPETIQELNDEVKDSNIVTLFLLTRKMRNRLSRLGISINQTHNKVPDIGTILQDYDGQHIAVVKYNDNDGHTASRSPSSTASSCRRCEASTRWRRTQRRGRRTSPAEICWPRCDTKRPDALARPHVTLQERRLFKWLYTDLSLRRKHPLWFTPRAVSRSAACMPRSRRPTRTRATPVDCPCRAQSRTRSSTRRRRRACSSGSSPGAVAAAPFRPSRKELHATDGVLDNLFDDALAPDLMTDLKVPVNLIWGEHDPWEPIAEAERWVQTIPCVKSLTTIGNSGHCPHDEAPTAVNESLITYLRGNAS